jgi:hypothetical protein
MLFEAQGFLHHRAGVVVVMPHDRSKHACDHSYTNHSRMLNLCLYRKTFYE